VENVAATGRIYDVHRKCGHMGGRTHRQRFRAGRHRPVPIPASLRAAGHDDDAAIGIPE
jgi:hypothetical protein